MENYEKKVYSRKLSAAEAATVGPRTWYLPHFGVINPNRPGKVRLVFDSGRDERCFFKYYSVKRSWPDCVILFREKPIGVCAGIVEKFHQLQIITEDQDSRLKSRIEPKDEYVMNVMTRRAHNLLRIKTRKIFDRSFRLPWVRFVLDKRPRISSNARIGLASKSNRSETDSLRMNEEIRNKCMLLIKTASDDFSRFSSY